MYRAQWVIRLYQSYETRESGHSEASTIWVRIRTGPDELTSSARTALTSQEHREQYITPLSGPRWSAAARSPVIKATRHPPPSIFPTPAVARCTCSATPAATVNWSFSLTKSWMRRSRANSTRSATGSKYLVVELVVRQPKKATL